MSLGCLAKCLPTFGSIDTGQSDLEPLMRVVQEGEPIAVRNRDNLPGNRLRLCN